MSNRVLPLRKYMAIVRGRGLNTLTLQINNGEFFEYIEDIYVLKQMLENGREK